MSAQSWIEQLLDFFQHNPWGIVLTALLTAWAWYNWKVLHSTNKPDSIQGYLRLLRHDRLGKIYRQLLQALLNALAQRIGDKAQFLSAVPAMPIPTGQRWIWRCFGCNPFTEASYKVSLILALIYPIVAFLLLWALGVNNWFADVQFADTNTPDYVRWGVCAALIATVLATMHLVRLSGLKRWLATAGYMSLVSAIATQIGQESFTETLANTFIVFLTIFASVYAGGFVVAWAITRSVGQAHQAIYHFAVAVAVAVAFAVAGAVAFAVAVAVAVAFAVAFAGAGAGAFAVAVAVAVADAVAVAVADAFAIAIAIADAIAFAFAGAFVVLLNTFYKKLQYHRAGWFWLIYSIGIITLGFVSLTLLPDPVYFFLIAFYLLLPLINAPIDWLSLGITRGLLQAICNGRHSGWWALVWAILDFVLALLFLLAIASVSVITVEVANGVAGRPLLPLAGEAGLFAQLRNPAHNPEDFYWIYFLLLSTLVPTVFHMLLAGCAIILWVPVRLRRWAARKFNTDQHAVTVVWFYVTFTPLAGLLVPITLCCTPAGGCLTP